ncbi:MAG: hypothetical protein WA056_14285 [Gallionella sp.]
MMKLDKTLNAWGTPDFAATLKQEIERLDVDQLPLQQGLSVGSYVLAEPITATILSVAETGNLIRIKAGIFFKSVIGGCSCAGDPTPTGEIDEYCEVWLDIDKATAATAIALVTE